MISMRSAGKMNFVTLTTWRVWGIAEHSKLEIGHLSFARQDKALSVCYQILVFAPNELWMNSNARRKR